MMFYDSRSITLMVTSVAFRSAKAVFVPDASFAHNSFGFGAGVTRNPIYAPAELASVERGSSPENETLRFLATIAARPHGAVIPLIIALRSQAPLWRKRLPDFFFLVMIIAHWGRAQSWRRSPHSQRPEAKAPKNSSASSSEFFSEKQHSQRLLSRHLPSGAKVDTESAILNRAKYFGLFAACSILGCSQQPASVDSQANVASTPVKVVADEVGSAGEERGTRATAETSFRFREIGAESGFDFQRYDDMKGQRRILEVNGGGVAMFDFDQDGALDIFMSNGCRLPLIQDTRETPGKLFRNLHVMTFRDCSASSGLQQFGFCFGCAVADANDDGFEDLYLTAYGGNQFWINNGDGTFSEVASANGTLTRVWGSSAAFADLNGDTYLDLYVANYLDESDTDPRLCPEPSSPDGYVGCSPAIFQGVPDTLFLSNGAGNYLDASVAAGLQELPGKALGVVICDLGRDARPEIYVANDGEPNYLLTVERTGSLDVNVQGIRLHDEATAANVALNEQGYAQASMGVVAADLDRNGAMDIFLTHFFGDTNTLYLNRTSGPDLMFEEATRQSLLGPPSRSVLGFGVVAMDVDNNGWKDLLIANGHVDDRTWMKAAQPYKMLPQVFENLQNGTFDEASDEAGTYFQKPTLGRGVAMGDLDRDGRLDAVISHQLAPSVILKNETDCGDSVTVRLVGTSSSRTPIGTKIRVAGSTLPTEEQFIGGGSFQSACANEIHIGGIPATDLDLEITWPDGRVEIVQLPGKGEWLIREGFGLGFRCDRR